MRKRFFRHALMLALVLVLASCNQPTDHQEALADDPFIPVTGIRGALPEHVLTGTELNLNSYVTVEPENATNQIIAWGLANPEQFGVSPEEVADGIFTPSLPGIMQIRAAIAKGKAAQEDFVKGDYQITVLEPDSFVAVTGITLALPETVLTGTELNLNDYVTVEPENASNRTIGWTIASPEQFGVSPAEVADGIFTLSAAGEGTLEITATIAKGKADGTDFVKTSVLQVQEPLVPVQAIRDVPERGFAGSVIDLSSATVEPPNATYKTIVWSILDAGATGVSSILEGGFTAPAPGRVVLRASVAYPDQEGSYTQDFTVTIGVPPPLTWTKAAHIPAQMPNEIQTICYGNGVFVAGSRANDGRIAYSTDGGISWTGLDGTATTFGTNFVHVKFLNNRFWAVGGGGHMAYSDNGASWTAVIQEAIVMNIVEIAYGTVDGKGILVAAGDQGTMAYSEDNGLTWIQNDQIGYFSNTNGTAPSNFKAIHWADGKFLAVGQHSKGIYSRDGKTWTTITPQMYGILGSGLGGQSGMSAISYGAGLYVVASNGLLLVSPDCETWEKIDMLDLGEGVGFPRGHRYGWINSLLYVDGFFVLGGADGEAAYSLDGRDWKPIPATNPLFHNFHFINGLAYGGGTFVAVGATCADPNCSNDPKSINEGDHSGNAGCIAYARP